MVAPTILYSIHSLCGRKLVIFYKVRVAGSSFSNQWEIKMYPKQLKYSVEHIWVKSESNNMARIGITHYYEQQLKKINFLELPEKTTTVTRDETFGVIESSKATSDLYSPASGTVAEVNKSLEVEPGIINRDPYGEGWMLVIELDNPNDLDSLLSADEYLDLFK